MVTQTNKNFYDRLIEGNSRKFLSYNKRFSIYRPTQLESSAEYFDPIIKEFFDKKSHLLDFGCGTGYFSNRVAAVTKKVTGIDASIEFVRIANSKLAKNAQFFHNDGIDNILKSNQFTGAILVDVLHHLESPEVHLEYLRSSLPGQRVVIFEPNIKNPAILLLHIFDRNERGLLKYKNFKAYKNVLTKSIQIEEIRFNGLLIAPASKFLNMVVRILNHHYFKYFAFLNPKIVIIGKFKQI